MALLSCPSCKRMVSSEATTCPKCGHPLNKEWAEKGLEKKHKQKNISRISWAIIFIVGIWWIWPDGSSSVPQARSSAVDSMSSLEKMALAFTGGHTKDQIKKALDPVMREYRNDITEEGYSRAGSVLVGMRKESGVSEMELLRCMKSMNTDGILSLPEAAALCSVVLQK